MSEKTIHFTGIVLSMYGIYLSMLVGQYDSGALIFGYPVCVVMGSLFVHMLIEDFRVVPKE